MKRLAAFALAGAVLAGPGAAQAPTALTSEQTIAARQSAFMLSGAAFGSMKAAIDAGGDVNHQAFAARSIARWAKTLASMFPAGTNVAPSKAKPEVWTDRAGFEAAAADYAAAADKLVALAQANDKAGFAAQWTETRNACQACHDKFRVQPAR